MVEPDADEKEETHCMFGASFNNKQHRDLI